MSTRSISGDTTFVRGAAPVLAVTVHRHMVFGPGALKNPVDFTVMVHLLFAITEGSQVTAAALLAMLREQGVQSPGDTVRLIGRDAVYASIARLVELGFIRRVELANEKFPGRRGRIVYEVYEQPLYNPDMATVPQFAMFPGQPEAGGISAGQNVSGSAGSWSPASGSAGNIQNGHSAGQNTSGSAAHWNHVPPTPPRGVVTPLPPTPSGTVPDEVVTAVTGEGGQPSGQKTNPERIAAAVELLSLLDGPLTLNTKQRQELAPYLLEQADLEGWPLTTALLAELGKDLPSMIKAPKGFLRKRLDDLKPHRAKAAAAALQIMDPCLIHPGRERSSCVPCRSGRDDVVLEAPQAPAEMHQSEVSTVAEVQPSVLSDAARQVRETLEAAKAEAQARKEAQAAAKAGRARGFRKKLAQDAEAAARAEEAHRNELLNQLEQLAANGGEFIPAPAAALDDQQAPEPSEAIDADPRAAFAAFTGGFQLPSLD
ncbi:hypothetical protein OG444_40005 (plasmid) [Streptomyces sp. NBC_01232]|uniref:hypothetical protein n=1 Tax=Streptomyces sp. NBC_01232 TaxID=2903786 RepID=UPI002E0F5C70|nr:hypothetical protein OG444_40005 [Streptomyces sp. NBC_01232]